MTHPLADEIVEMIRADELVGVGSCSPVDECYTDDELVEAFGWDINGKRHITAKGALRKARAYHNAWADRFADMEGWASW
jgi:hypothetical protein